MAQPRILFITRKWAPAVGGMETYSMRLAEALGEIEPVQVIALPGKPDGMPPGLFSLMLFPFRVLAALARRDRPPEVVHIGDMALWPLALFPRLLFGSPRMVLSAHGTDVVYYKRGGLTGRLYGAYLRLGARLLRKAVVIANSSATVMACADTGWPEAIPILLATDCTAPPAPKEISKGILFVGRLVERKGCRWFIEQVLPHLPEEHELFVVGKAWDPAERKALNHPRVRYLGHVEDEELFRLIRTSLSVIMPNIPVASGDYEGFGIVALEVAANGGLLLAAASGGLTDAVIDKRTGFLLTPGNAEVWISKIAEIAHWSGEFRAAFLAQAQVSVNKDFNWGRVATETHSTYGLSTS